MKKMVLSLALIGCLVLSACTTKKATDTELAIGKTAPNFSLPAAGGERVSLADYKGKFVVLEWKNHLCPFVKKHYASSNMQGLQKHYTNKDVVWISIISSAPGKQGHVNGKEALMIAQNEGSAASKILLDEAGNVARLYQAKTTPHMFVINKKGILVYMGAIDSIRSTNQADIAKAKNYVANALDEVLADKKVTTTETEAYGCSIKLAY